MKIKAGGYDRFILEEIFNPILLVSSKNEKLSIVMRDDGFELWYQDKEDGEYHQYEFKNGVIRKMKNIEKGNDIKTKIEELTSKITKENLSLLDADERNSEYCLEKLFAWQDEYNDLAEWEEFKDRWCYCERCKGYSEGSCICYAR